MGDRDWAQLLTLHRHMGIYCQGAGRGSVNGKLLRGNVKVQEILAKLTGQDSLLKTGQDDQTSPGWRRVRNLIRYQGWGWFRLHWLNRVLSKTGFYKEGHRWAEEKIQEPDSSLVKQRIFVNPLFPLPCLSTDRRDTPLNSLRGKNMKHQFYLCSVLSFHFLQGQSDLSEEWIWNKELEMVDGCLLALASDPPVYSLLSVSEQVGELSGRHEAREVNLSNSGGMS